MLGGYRAITKPVADGVAAPRLSFQGWGCDWPKLIPANQPSLTTSLLKCHNKNTDISSTISNFTSRSFKSRSPREPSPLTTPDHDTQLLTSFHSYFSPLRCVFSSPPPLFSGKTPPIMQHPAMIFADNSNDGPEIGTLVVIVDRGRHLPNRKSTKQDPYCQGRLGKTCNKTKTDRRGGQTPRW
jgi:C2 domain-containing protein